MQTIPTAAIALAVAIAPAAASPASQSPAAPSPAAPSTVTLDYKGKPVNAYRGYHPDFPAAFVGAPLCENGQAMSDARSSCIQLNRDGTGTWENDRGPGRVEPAAPIEWFIVADQKGTVTKVGTAERDSYFVILRFTQSYYSAPAGTMRAFPANIVRGAPTRAVIDSKYRNLE